MQKVSAALLSYGMSGKVFHAPFLELHPGFELTGAWERSKKKIQEDYPLVKSYDSLEALLNDEDVQLVIVNTPTETHYEYAKKALEAGKDVLVEKAFTTTVAEAQELFEIAEDNNRKLTVFQNRRWDSDFKTVKDIYDKKILGDTVEAEFHFDRFNPNLSPKAHKESRNAGAGILKDLGSHIIDQALFLFGYPFALFADVRTTRQHSVIDDWFDITLFYKNFRVRLKASYFVREPLPSYVIHGTKGSFIKSRGDVQEDELKAGKKPMVTDWGKEPDFKSGVLHTEIEGLEIREHVPTLPGNYYHFFDEFWQYLRKNGKNPVPAQEAIRTMKIIEAALESSDTKTVIDL